MLSTSVYDAFGRDSSTGGYLDPWAYDARWGYYRDAESGGLYDCRARYYDPMGRWETKDPIGYEGGVNLYAYCGGNPVGWADPSGLFTVGGYEFTVDVVRDALGTAWHAHEAADRFGAGDDGSHDGEPGYEESKHLFELAHACEIGLEILTDTEALEGCFAAGTRVRMADGSSKAIEAVRPGDRVLTRDQKGSDDAPTEGGTVSGTKVHVHDGSLLVKFEDGSSVHTTPEHPFYVHGRGFTPAGELKAGDEVSEDGRGLDRVAVIVRLSAPERVYNLTVAGEHTYFVGAGSAWLWVHNTCGRNSRARRREWSEREGQDWPKDENGNNYDAHHKKPLADGGEDTLDNIEPMEHNEHMKHHRENGDFKRWAQRRGRGGIDP